MNAHAIIIIIIKTSKIFFCKPTIYCTAGTSFRHQLCLFAPHCLSKAFIPSHILHSNPDAKTVSGAGNNSMMGTLPRETQSRSFLCYFLLLCIVLFSPAYELSNMDSTLFVVYFLPYGAHISASYRVMHWV